MRWEITKAGVIFSLIYQPCSLLHTLMRHRTVCLCGGGGHAAVDMHYKESAWLHHLSHLSVLSVSVPKFSSLVSVTTLTRVASVISLYDLEH